MISLDYLDSSIKIRSCRICLEANDDMTILDEQNGWLKMFEICFGIALTLQDEPRSLCKKCAETVQSYVNFKEKCKISHKLWKTLTSDVKCYVKQETEHLEVKCDNAELIQQSLACDVPLEFDYDNTVIKQERSDEERDFEDPIITHEVVDVHALPISVKNIKSSSKHSKTGSYKCKKCKRHYVYIQRYITHKKVCLVKKRIKTNDDGYQWKKQYYGYQNYAYDCGKNHDIKENKELQSSTKTCLNIVQDKNHPFNIFSCGLCMVRFTDRKSLCKHLSDHWSNNNLRCQLCDFVGIDLAAIAAHRFSHFKKGSVNFLCHFCEKSKSSLLALHFHYRMVHLNKPGGYCSRCRLEFTSLRRWKMHEKKHDAPKYICDICGSRFHFKYAIKEHMNTTHLKMDLAVCDTCGKCFSRHRYLKLHQETVHAKSEPLECSHCNRKFKSQYSLNVHIKAVTREKQLKCEVCNKDFGTSTALKTHMINHSDERPFVCKTCGSRYKRKSYLTVHMLKHSGFLPHCCPVCKKVFATTKQLKVHSSVHTGIRKYTCIVPNCPRSFHSNKLLLDHLMLRHKNETNQKLIEDQEDIAKS